MSFLFIFKNVGISKNFYIYMIKLKRELKFNLEAGLYRQEAPIICYSNKNPLKEPILHYFFIQPLMIIVRWKITCEFLYDATRAVLQFYHTGKPSTKIDLNAVLRSLVFLKYTR